MADITIQISRKLLKRVISSAGAILLASLGAILWSSGSLRPAYELRFYVPEIQGLKVGAPVEIDGIRVGKVHGINLVEPLSDSSRRVEVILHVEKRFQDKIFDTSIASFRTDGLLGDQYVIIKRGLGGKPLEPGAAISSAVLVAKQVSVADVLGAIANGAHPGDTQQALPNRQVPADAQH